MISLKNISHSKKYIISNLFNVLGPIIWYPIITPILGPSVYWNYVIFISVAMIALGLTNMLCLLGFKRNYFEYNDTELFNDYIISIQLFILSIFIVFSF